MEKQKSQLVTFLLLLLLLPAALLAQTGKYKLSSASRVAFTTNGVMTDIAATNNKPQGVIDFDSKMFAVKLRIDEFVFSNSLMQKHFLENYMESDKYPEAKYTGTFVINGSKGNEVSATLNGKLEIHGIAKPVTLNVVFTNADNKISGEMTFDIKTEEYRIKVPDLVFDKVGDIAKITVKFEAQKL